MSSVGHRVVAVVVDRYETYQRDIVETLARRLGAAGYGTLCIAGRDLQAQDAMLARTAGELYHPLVHELDASGAVLLSTMLGHGFPGEEVRRFVERLRADTPVVSLGVAIDGVPSVALDSADALDALMAHMTRDPGRRRFVFLRGFADDPDTHEREGAFRAALARRGIEVDEALVLEGRYRSADAFAAVDALLRDGTRFDAVVAANDVMAASAVAALDRHGLSVPGDVIVSGFDDEAVALEIEPPLTTVRHHIARQAEAAAALMLETLECGEGTAAHVAIEATFVARDSSRHDLAAVAAPSGTSGTSAGTGGGGRAARVTSRLQRSAQRDLQEMLFARLAACTSVPDVWRRLREGLDALGVERAWVVLHEEPRNAVAAARETSARPAARLTFALEEGDATDEERFPRRDILPSRLGAELERGVLVLSPLSVGELQLGYLLVDPTRVAGLELAALATSVALALRQLHLVDDLERRADALRCANGALTEFARRDSLTGLANRTGFHEELGRALGAARDEGEECALLFLDLDGFKLINDTLGHGAGDRLLCVVASRIAAVLDADASLARLGGDEFTVIVPERIGEDAATAIAARVLAAIARPVTLGERVVNVSASIGVARYPADGEDIETLLRNADTAMYHAKACGKNRHARYVAAFNSEALVELELREAIRRGIDAGEFHLHYQPRVSLGEGRLVAFEALLRWARPDGVEIGPARFVDVAERSGLIGALDAFSLDAACRQAGAWAAAGAPVVVAVNLSVKRLQEPDIVDQVVAALRRHRLDPRLLELEITESAAMADVAKNIETLGALRALGVRVAIDDFGTGHSSLSYLSRLPANSLKIDRSFLTRIGTGADVERAPGAAEPVDAAIVRSVVALGRSLGFRVVAEGVENDAQIAFLVDLGCDEAQGYRFGRPLDVPTATRRLRRSRAEPPVRIDTAG